MEPQRFQNGRVRRILLRWADLVRLGRDGAVADTRRVQERHECVVRPPDVPATVDEYIRPEQAPALPEAFSTSRPQALASRSEARA